ncbi:MAG: hypothetical protein ACRELV_11735 [Longimicrobiales bacterium]
MTEERSDEATLRAKYLDWCSARIADRILELTPEQVYELAHAAGEPIGAERGEDVPSYRQLVERATEVLARRMDFPPFVQWAREYEADPSAYEADLVGFWKLGRPRPDRS